MTLRAGEYGKIIRLKAFFDMSANTALAILITDPQENTATVTATLGTTTITEDGITYTANEYMNYTLLSGDIDEAGEWTFQGRYDEGATKRLLSEIHTETVE